MSLRNSLRSATELQVAPVNARNAQLSEDLCATGGATDTQQPAANPHECSLFAATEDATHPQQLQKQGRNSKAKPEELRVASAKARNSQPGGLTAHRLLPALIASINNCCDARGDDQNNRAQLIAESALLVPHEQADMLAHFEAETTRWQQANRGKQP